MLNRLEKIRSIRNSIRGGLPSIGTWMQVPNASIAEIMGSAGYDWVCIDMEHGAISVSDLPDICRAIEMGGSLPIARLSVATPVNCKSALDSGCGGLIFPQIEDANQLKLLIDSCRWPPLGKRGVGYSRANLFGKYFNGYKNEAQEPLIVAMIESLRGLENLDEILKVEDLDAILVGPYDLSASLGRVGEFESPIFVEAMQKINLACRLNKIPCGIHIVEPSLSELRLKIQQDYRFIAYSIDAVFLNIAATFPKIEI